MKNFKKLFASLLCALMCLGVFATAANAATNPAKTAKSYSYNGKKWVLESTTKYTYKKGNLKSTVTTYPGRKDKYKTTYSNSKTKSVVKGYSNGKLEYTSTTTFNKKGRVTKNTYKGTNGYSDSTTYSYNKKGTKATATFKNSYGDKSTSTLYYNKKGQLIKETSKDTWGSNTSTHKYNKKGWETLYTYTSKSIDGSTYKSTEKTSYYTSGKKKGLRKKYSSSWSEIGPDFKDSGSGYTSYSYKLNKNGTVKEEIITRSSGYKTKIVYTY